MVPEVKRPVKTPSTISSPLPMPAVRVGRSFRVPKDALDHYLATAYIEGDRLTS